MVKINSNVCSLVRVVEFLSSVKLLSRKSLDELRVKDDPPHKAEELPVNISTILSKVVPLDVIKNQTECCTNT